MRWLIPLLLISSSAVAQQQQQEPYAPITLTEQEYKGLLNHLLTQPMGVVESIVVWLRQKEAQAQVERTKLKVGEK